MSQVVGLPVERVDGHAKVTGGAKYAADTVIPGVLHGFLVLSTIARGRVTGIDTRAASAAPGVVAVFTHTTMPRLKLTSFPYVKGFIPLQDAEIHHNGQPVAYVVATTLEQAQDAATLVDVKYAGEKPVGVLEDALDQVYLPDGENDIVRGDPAAGLAQAEVKVDASYSSPTHHHNPIEPPVTVARWDGGKLTVHESAQGISFTRLVLAQSLGVPASDIRVLTPYLGGGFGAKGPVWAHTLLTAAVARALGKPVKLVLTRAQMYYSTGHRAQFRQQVTLGAKRDGTLTALVNISTQQTSRSSDTLFNESESSRLLYACPNLHVRQQGVKLDVATPSFQRSPETTSHFGLETALDELSYALGMDPLELRLRNYTEVDPGTGAKFSSKHLRECYRLASDAFGWSRRNPKPGSTREGHEFVGWGMATEAHTYHGFPSSASVVMGTDGRVLARSGTQDIGTGTYTVMTQVVAQALGTPVDTVTFELGDTDFPAAGLSAASATVNSLSGAVDRAAASVRDAVIRLAVADARSPLHGRPPEQVKAEHGYLWAGGRRESYRAIMARHGKPVEGAGSSLNADGYTTGVVFIEVKVDPRVGRVRVTRAVTAHDPGRVMNRRTARGQVIGGVTWGIGFALMEHTVIDRGTARIANANLSTYLVPVSADVPEIETLFVDRPDPVSQALGAKGFGETPITGVPAAIGNAVYHATGRRIRSLPITQDKLL
ncbi:xanthine dehydrogenase YagR molybdenum-binding subunit [Amycolatopsis xylanica]|uniref:Xanthine dehydrogenase YagR molybdenum-binding subunit n=1 Tax=Amycolatopsis xylanica TaxID=589385 RepID=A0A1H3G034_9PSEU|nr:xanthine dehydrogenase family protein molybdopterin-binding subunit [Amycolatopsis xylanica]SDX95998.1 xanthine dehydrogenase YagR molybdenum-binding subunit [Amycolatopsis xylanica]